MQSKIIDIEILREQFSRTYIANIENKHLNEDKILSGEPIFFILKENFTGCEKNVNEIIDFDYYKKQCSQEIYKYIQSIIENYQHELELKNEDSFKFLKNIFKKDKDIEIIKEKIKLLTKLISDNEKLMSLVDFKFENFDDFGQVPFYQLKKNQKLFLVIQDPVSYLKIEQAYVKDITIIQTKSDSISNCSFEFNYELSYIGNTQSLKFDSMRKFDGKKCAINYNLAFFIDLDEAKEHCLKVLNGIKFNIDDKIKNIENFKEF